MPAERARSPHLIACCVFLAATLVMFGDVLLAGSSRVLSIPNDDITRPFFYWFPFSFGELAKGHLVLWNPHNYAGTPYFGGFGPAILYLPHWLHMILPTAFAINVGVAVHIFLSGVFVYLWTLHRRLHPAACILAGLVFMFCGAHFLQIYRGHLHCLTTLVWAPLILLAVDGILLSFSWKWPLVGMAAVAMQIFAGHVQYIYYTAIIVGLYALAGWLRSSHRLRDAGALLAIYAGGACLAAVQLLTGLQTAAESHRAAISYGVATSFAFPPENVLTLILPGIFGDLVTTPYWGRWNVSESSLFIGTAPFVLALCGLVHGAKAVRRFSFAMAVIVLVLAFGDYTPLFRLLYDHVPGFSNFRGTTKFIYLSSLFTVMLVAVGFDYVLRSPRVPLWLAALSLTAGGALVAIGSTLLGDCNAGGRGMWLPWLSSIWFLDEGARNFAVDQAASVQACVNSGTSMTIGGGTLLLLGCLLLATRRSRRFAYAVAILGVIEVMAYARYTRPTFDPRPLVARSDTLRRMLADAGAGEARVVSSDPHSYVALGARSFDLWGADPTVLGRYSDVLALTQGWPPDAIMVTDGLRKLSPLLGMFRLRYKLQIDDDRVTLRPLGLRELPRALLVPRWRVIQAPEQLLAAMGDPTFDFARVVLLESDPGLTPTAVTDAPSEDPGQVSVTDLSTDAMEIRAEVVEPSILLITDNFSASWRATPLAGSSADTYRVIPANHSLRGIPLAPGRHHLRLAYRPAALAVGAWVTVVSLIVYVAAAALLWRRDPRSHLFPPSTREYA